MIHDLLPYIIPIVSFWSAFFIASRYKRLRFDKVLRINFVILIMSIFYVGLVYSLFVVGIINQQGLIQLMRPINLALVFLPGLIVWRMSP